MKKINSLIAFILLATSPCWAASPTIRRVDQISNESGGSLISIPSTGSTLDTDTNTLTLTNKTMSGSSNTFSNISLTASVTGTLPVGNGGLGVANPTSGGVIVGAGSSAVTSVTCSSSGFALEWNGSSWACAAVTATPVNSTSWYTGGNGSGSTNTRIRRFSTAQVTTSDITYADSSTAGDTWTINTAGVYSITYIDECSGADTYLGVSVNSSNLSTDITNLSVTQVLTIFRTNTTDLTPMSVTAHFSVNDVIRAQWGANAPDATTSAQIRIVRVQ